MIVEQGRAVCDGIVASLEQPPFTHMDLVRSQLPRATGSAAGLCVGLAEQQQLSREVALPCAEALALLETMSLILHDIGAPGAAGPVSLFQVWQMPRTLNAADACYVLAHQRLLRLGEVLPPDLLFAVTELMDEACQSLAEVLADAITDEGVDWQKQINVVLATGSVGFVAVLAGKGLTAARDLQRRFATSLAAVDSFAAAWGVPAGEFTSLVADFLTIPGRKP